MLNIYRAYKSFNGSKVGTLEMVPNDIQNKITGIVYAPRSWHSGVLEFIRINCYNMWSYSDVNIIIYITKYDIKHWNLNKINDKLSEVHVWHIWRKVIILKLK